MTYQTNRNPPTSNRQLLIIFGIFLGIIIVIIWLVCFFVDNLVWIISPRIEQQLGTLIVPAYERLAQPSQTQDTLNKLLNKLELNLPLEQRKGRDYQVLYVPNKTVNALALPGDRIIIFSGLLKQADSENELMMILGHELGHFANRDHLRSILRQLILPITLASVTGNSDWLVSVASSVAVVSDAKYSQSQEAQADKLGLELLYKTYNHVAGATDFFDKLSNQKNSDLDFLSTHPSPKQRVKDLQRLIKEKHYQIGELSPLPKELLIR
ncbi:MAG: M48 family metallopeptidase [Cyanomargarita calcarea GSE-NOS-MK-12-04C]|uniref:M48 family metallopeptidase n=1 Tax=Cyanomargarita calcarea GSE-NOS-MK-12-04C TaxID=2839659 RepID=A0A951QW46_9CYAN|nr:M48 family metallopeptidase [Cyanomargarita calcarea GSE-NOS-MK-12-04C]